MSSNEQNSTQPNPTNESSGGGFDIEKILFILLSHKWKILISGTLGLIAAATLFLLQEPVYKSNAKLLVRYVVEALSIDEINTRMIAGRGMATPLNNEVAIITSLDLSREVAESISIEPEMLVPNAEGPITEANITAVIIGGLGVGFERNSNIINVSYTHSDPEVPTEVLGLLIDKYFEKHIKTYRSDLAAGVLEREIFEVKETLKAAEESITELMAGIISIVDEQVALSQRKRGLSEQIALAEADFSAQKRRVELMQNNLSESVLESQEQESDLNSLKESEVSQPSVGDVEKFKGILSRLELLNRQKAQNSLIHKSGSNTIKIIQQQINATESEKAELVARFPSLAMIEKSQKNDITEISVDSLDPNIELARLAEMEARLNILRGEKTKLESEIKRIAQVAIDVAPYQRRKEIAQARLRSLEAAKSRADRDTTSSGVSQGGLPNIGLIQRPSNAVPVTSDLVMKISLGLAGGGFAFGIGIALIIELFLDRTVKRPKEIEARLHIPLMLSIPYLKNDSTEKKSKGKLKNDKLSKKQVKNNDINQLSSVEPWVPSHFIRPFTDAIRDRLVCYFKVNEITEDTEFIALAGFLDDSGVSTIASGLASSFAEIDRKTLYVNLTADRLSPIDNVELEFGETDTHLWPLKNDLELVEQCGMLSVANINFRDIHGQIQQVTPKKLYDLILKLKSCDFEYVIFDMPPFGLVSPTLAMTRFMDKVIIVADAGKTIRDDIRYNYKELVSGDADIFTVFNTTNEKLSSWQ